MEYGLGPVRIPFGENPMDTISVSLAGARDWNQAMADADNRPIPTTLLLSDEGYLFSQSVQFIT